MKKLTIYQVIGLPICALSLFCLLSFISQNGINSNNTARNTNFCEPVYFMPEIVQQHFYETDESPKFYNGEILMPDYVHQDTLQVINADFLNEMILSNKYDIASDGDIYDVLQEGTVNIADYQDYITATAKK